MLLELVCHACGVTLQAETDEDLVELGLQHAHSIHVHLPLRDHVVARVRLHNQ